MHALQSLDALAVNIRCSRGQEICSPSRPADYWYRVVSGSARRCVIRPDGRRQIVDLLLPGDFFGFSEAQRIRFHRRGGRRGHGNRELPAQAR